MKFQIEKETFTNAIGEAQNTFWVWVCDPKEKICFSKHQTEDEALQEIEKIKDLFPINDVPEVFYDSPNGKIVRKTHINRYLDYKLQDMFEITAFNGNYIGFALTYKDALDKLEKYTSEFRKTTSKIIHEINK